MAAFGQHMAAYDSNASIYQQMAACGSICQHTVIYGGIYQHMAAYSSMYRKCAFRSRAKQVYFISSLFLALKTYAFRALLGALRTSKEAQKRSKTHPITMLKTDSTFFINKSDVHHIKVIFLLPISKNAIKHNVFLMFSKSHFLRKSD